MILTGPPRSLLVPEILQSSLMDCGPAALKAVLEGFGISTPYDRLRQACHTGVDGTSLDVLAAVGKNNGLKTHQLVVAKDSLFVPEARCLPAVAVAGLADGRLHFLVVWRQVGSLIQVMDPAGGRRWLHRKTLDGMLPVFSTQITASRWRKWAATPDAIDPLLSRIESLGVRASDAQSLVDAASRDPSWRSFARLDAATRMATQLQVKKLLPRGEASRRLMNSLTASQVADGASNATIEIPEHFFWVTADPTASDRLVARGLVLVHFSGTTSAPTQGERHARRDEPPAAPKESRVAAGQAQSEQCIAWTDPRMAAVAEKELARKTLRPFLFLWILFRHDAGAWLVLLVAAWTCSAAIAPLETLLLQALVTLNDEFGQLYQRVAGVVAISALLMTGLACDWWATRTVQLLARRLESRIRTAFLWKLPRLSIDYLRTRPSSDMAGRGNALHVIRLVPVIWNDLLQQGLALGTTVLCLIWLHPQAWRLITATALISLIVARASHTALNRRNVELDSETANLNGFYLDSLLGATPVVAHGAQRAVCSAYDQRLTGWARTARSTHNSEALVQGVQSLVGLALTASLVLSLVSHHIAPARLLLITYWAFRIPEYARRLVLGHVALRSLSGLALRLISPLAAEPSQPSQGISGVPLPTLADASAARLELIGVSLKRERQTVLRDLHLVVEPGTHVSVVGASGSGKSTLVRLLLGCEASIEGCFRIDGAPATPDRVEKLRSETAWVDPETHLWDRSLFENLTFGEGKSSHVAVSECLAVSDLADVVDRLPDGLNSSLGEAGVRLSGGQGQRVRLGRATMRQRARLVILDEPFRGLERARRRALLQGLREHWRHTTLILVSHDVEDTTNFDRTIVLDEGRIVEDGVPHELAAREQSVYGTLLRNARSLADAAWSPEQWRCVDVSPDGLRQ